MTPAGEPEIVDTRENGGSTQLFCSRPRRRCSRPSPNGGAAVSIFYLLCASSGGACVTCFAASAACPFLYLICALDGSPVVCTTTCQRCAARMRGWSAPLLCGGDGVSPCVLARWLMGSGLLESRQVIDE